MNPSVTIPEPCHEDWNKMNPVGQGRHCQSCCKTVIDFSARSNEEITDYLRANAAKKICGNFRRDQVKPHVAEKPKSRYRAFMAAVYLFFTGLLVSSCGTRSHSTDQMRGGVSFDNSLLPPVEQKASAEDTVKKKPVCKKPEVTVEDSIEVFMRGEIAPLRPDPKND